MIKIFIDIYFFLNFAIDYLCLKSVEMVCILPQSKTKCTLIAIAGGLYSVLAFFYAFPKWLGFIFAWIMIEFIALKRRVKIKLGAYTVFLVSEVFIGGLVNALKNLCMTISSKGLLLTASIILLSVFGSNVCQVIQFMMKRRLSAISLNARVWHRGRCSNITLLVDSGNLVREYATKKRVIFVKADAIKKITGETDTIFEREKCHVIPIDTTSGKANVLGFVPDKIEFSDKKYNREEFIVVPDRNGSKFGGYDGIAPFV